MNDIASEENQPNSISEGVAIKVLMSKTCESYKVGAYLKADERRMSGGSVG